MSNTQFCVSIKKLKLGEIVTVILILLMRFID